VAAYKGCGGSVVRDDETEEKKDISNKKKLDKKKENQKLYEFIEIVFKEDNKLLKRLAQ
jgi:hypothetical protein